MHLNKFKAKQFIDFWVSTYPQQVHQMGNPIWLMNINTNSKSQEDIYNGYFKNPNLLKDKSDTEEFLLFVLNQTQRMWLSTYCHLDFIKNHPLIKEYEEYNFNFNVNNHLWALSDEFNKNGVHFCWINEDILNNIDNFDSDYLIDVDIFKKMYLVGSTEFLRRYESAIQSIFYHKTTNENIYFYYLGYQFRKHKDQTFIYDTETKKDMPFNNFSPMLHNFILPEIHLCNSLYRLDKINPKSIIIDDGKTCYNKTDIKYHEDFTMVEFVTKMLPKYLHNQFIDKTYLN